MKGTIRAVGAALLLIALAGCQGPYLMEIMQEQAESMRAQKFKAITAFSFVSPAAMGTIDENAKTISVTVPYGTNVTALVAKFTTTGSSVVVGSTVQVSGTTANDFSSPVIYTVTAADGSTASYTAGVRVAPSSAKAITAYSFASVGAVGTIDEAAKTIAVKVPYGTDVTPLVAKFTTMGSSVMVGSVVQVSGATPNDFRSPITYTVTAADGSTASYTVTVTVALSAAKAITAFSFSSIGAAGMIDEGAKKIAVTVPYDTSVTALVATFSTTGSSVKVGSTVQASGATTNDFRSPVIYTVTAADGSSVNYAVTVTVAPRAWQTVGTSGFSTGYVSRTSLAIDSTGTPYVAYLYGNTATVTKFAAGAWQTLGSGAGAADFPSLAIDSTGMPYVAYEDGGNSNKTTVMKCVGGSRQTVGAAGFSAGEALYVSLAVDSTDTPYVAYQDGGNSYKATVMKYAGGSWQTVGTAGFSAGTAGYASLAIDSTDTPYVAYQDWGNGKKATVMKFAGGSWQTVGAAGFSAGQVGDVSLAIDSKGTPYIAYGELGNSYAATVMKNIDGSWQTVGTTGFSTFNGAFPVLAIDSTATPYVAYCEYAGGYRANVMRFK